MSRKTRKLIWSAPLVAVLAVAGVLAIFVALSPQEAAAHEAAMHGPPGPVTGLDANPATDDTSTGELEGRTAITITWDAPDTVMGGAATGYRIDYSEDSRVWRNLEANVSEAMADANCGTSADADQRCYTDPGLDPNTTLYYRVFAMNASGISPVSDGPTYDFATTTDYASPSVVRGLTATTHHMSMIDLAWQAPTDSGGADVMWYCLHVAPLSTDFSALVAATCLNATGETAVDDDGNVAGITEDLLTDAANVASAVIVVPGSATTFSHTGLATPDVLSLRYMVYAVTDKDGDEDTTNTVPAAVTDERRISLAASNTATGRTRAALPDVTTPVTVKPGRIQSLRVVAYVETSAAQMRLYWHMPTNYPFDPNDPDNEDNENNADNWSLRVESLGEDTDDDGDRDWVMMDVPDGDPGLRGLGVTQYTVVTNAQIADLLSGPMTFRVLYENDHDKDSTVSGFVSTTTDAIEGIERQFVVEQLDATADDEDLLPVINAFASDANGGATGLRFRYNILRPTTAIDLLWDPDPNQVDATDDEVVGDPPTGYVVEISHDVGMTWGPLANVTSPRDLGATRSYTHRNVIPGQLYTYRVFPEFRNSLGLPAREDASSQEDDLPPKVLGLTVTADGEDALVLNWRKVNKAGKHDVKGYLVQLASGDVSNNNITLDGDADAQAWINLGVGMDSDGDPVRMTVSGADNTTYEYGGVDDDDLRATPGIDLGIVSSFVDTNFGASSARWFRVIAITDENDGDSSNGGTDVVLANGDLRVVIPSPSEELPESDDMLGADPVYGKTAPPAGAPDQGADVAPAPPVDLTAEEASNTNLIETEDRGVLLLWNEPENAAGITSYVIERRIDGGTELTIDAITWASVDDPDQRTSYSDPTPPVDGEMLEYRVGSLGSAVTKTQWAVWIEYPTHQAIHMPTAPQSVTAVADSDTAVTVSWLTPADTGGSDITGFTVRWKQSDAADYDAANMATAAATASSHMVTGLMAGTSYTFQVRATNAEGDSYWSMYAMAMTDAAAVTELTAPSDVMATVGVTDPGAITVTWTPGENATGGHLVLLFNSDFTEVVHVEKATEEGMYTILGVATAGDYVVVVVSVKSRSEYLYDSARVNVP